MDCDPDKRRENLGTMNSGKKSFQDMFRFSHLKDEVLYSPGFRLR